MHSWVKANGIDSDSNATFDERVSDIIPSTCGGGRKARSLDSLLIRDSSLNTPIHTSSLKNTSSNKKNMNSDAFQNSKKFNLVSSNQFNEAPSPFSEDREWLLQLDEKIKKHPLPGAGATQLERLVNLPWRADFRQHKAQDLNIQNNELQSHQPIHIKPTLPQHNPSLNISMLSGRQLRNDNFTENIKPLSTRVNQNTFASTLGTNFGSSSFDHSAPLKHKGQEPKNIYIQNLNNNANVYVYNNYYYTNEIKKNKTFNTSSFFNQSTSSIKTQNDFTDYNSKLKENKRLRYDLVIKKQVLKEKENYVLKMKDKEHELKMKEVDLKMKEKEHELKMKEIELKLLEKKNEVLKLKLQIKNHQTPIPSSNNNDKENEEH
ncbi:hypothetical protein Mgra_00007978 [Meloidogyne graminicola]|uniref:Uncharacterized protein n=1 Tax=Meloidogyne graminicola TaxID=189291 RepID=A0A8S9ZH85_9BILA|nr:hypothetical protein Mgra_00007978 [Meloidogyne graminicola]